MSKEFMELGQEYIMTYEKAINQLLQVVTTDETFSDTIRHLCHEAIYNNWSLEKKVNIVNMITR